MPRLSMDYSKTIIYKICCKDTNIKECYVGHTTNFVKRKYQHNLNCNTQTKKHNYYVYQFIRENGGWDCWSMVQVEELNAENRLQAETRERYWIETLQSKLNKKLPTRTKKEYDEANKEKLNEYYKEYYNVNKKEITEKKKEYQQIHKIKIAEYYKEWSEEHKKELTEKAKIKYTCECGSTLRIFGKARHEKNKKHLAFLELTENIG